MYATIFRCLVFTALLFFGTAAPGYAAYVDPGSGSLLLQAILASILGTVFFFRRSVSRVIGFFRRKPPADDAVLLPEDRHAPQAVSKKTPRS
jgi:hypothetical protein